jgi:hypothetical protein
MQFHICLNGTTRGPLSADHIRLLIEDHVLQASDLVSISADGDWKPLSAFRELMPAATSAALTETAPSAPIPPPVSVIAPASEPPLPPVVPPAVPDLTPLSVDALGPYSRSTLAPNEKPFFKTSLHWIVFVRYGILAVLAFLFLAMPFAKALRHYDLALWLLAPVAPAVAVCKLQGHLPFGACAPR